MKILVISNIEWSNQNAFGNTISNWFFNIKDNDFAAIYTRKSLPENVICKEYYSITFPSIVKNIFTPSKIGKYIKLDKKKENKNCTLVNKKPDTNFEKQIISVIHRYGFQTIYKLQNWAFGLKIWSNKRFESFLYNFSPDIVFAFITSSEPSKQILFETLRLIPNAKFVAFIADDVYGNARNEREKQIIKEEIMRADKLFGASELLCEEYKKIFKKDIEVLYKCCEFTEIRRKCNSILKIVYAGNLYYGRKDTLIELIKCIQKYNDTHNKKIKLEIYTTTAISSADYSKLNIEGVSKICGARPYEEIKMIMQEADIVLHVESFQGQEKKKVRYSFSTKIIDCLQSGSVLMAIGPAGIASIEYARKIPGCFIIDNLENIKSVLEEIEKEDLYKHAIEIRKFSEISHSPKRVKEQFIKGLQ